MKEAFSYEELMFSCFYNTQLHFFITQKLIEGTNTIDLQEFFSQQSIQRAYPIQAAEISEFLFSVIWLKEEDPKISNITPSKLGISEKYGCDDSTDFLRHLRNAISHKNCVFYKDGSALFYDKNLKGKETFHISLNPHQFLLLKEEFRNLVISELYPKIIKQELITKVELGSNAYLGNYAFCGNVNLETIVLPMHIDIIPDWAFCNCISLKCASLPMKVSKIGKRAFSGCEKALIILNPKNLLSIGDYAFADCTSIKHITINSNTIVGRRAFSGWTASQTIYIHGDKKNLGKWANDWNDNCDAEIVYS